LVFISVVSLFATQIGKIDQSKVSTQLKLTTILFLATVFCDNITDGLSPLSLWNLQEKRAEVQSFHNNRYCKFRLAHTSRCGSDAEHR